MIHLDTHLVVWIYREATNRISGTARRLIERRTVAISPTVLLELELLFERREVPGAADVVFQALSDRIALSVSPAPYATIVARARTFAWTRDPFDRLIVANAMADGARLLTADGAILENFADAVW